VLTSYSGNLDFYEKQRAQNETQAQAAFERQQAMLAKEMRFIERFKAQAAKAAQVQSRVKKLDKIEKVEPPKRRKQLDFEFPPAPPAKTWRDRRRPQALRRARRSTTALDLSIRRRERLAVMGVNGAGKSTLLKLIAGETQPDEGNVTLGPSVRMGYFAQHAMELLDPHAPSTRPWRNVPAGQRRVAEDAGGCFGFSGRDADKTAAILSGGEKARVCWPNPLCPPELPRLRRADKPPRHHYQGHDRPSLADYEGTMLFVSHDRQFLARFPTASWSWGRRAHPLRRRLYRIRARSGHEAPGLR
jgi:ATPase subunit of ABC transporter with duplicated ATPase domains